MENKPFFTKFISSFLWALASMESRETSLIVESDIEKSFFICANLLGYSMLGVVIHSIQFVCSESDHLEEKRNKRFTKLNLYLK